MAWTLALAAVCALAAFGAVMWRAGRAAARLQGLEKERESDKRMEKILDVNDSLSRAALLDWLRGQRQKRL